jgi:hypothetical protein
MPTLPQRRRSARVPEVSRKDTPELDFAAFDRDATHVAREQAAIAAATAADTS